MGRWQEQSRGTLAAQVLPANWGPGHIPSLWTTAFSCLMENNTIWEACCGRGKAVHHGENTNTEPALCLAEDKQNTLVVLNLLPTSCGVLVAIFLVPCFYPLPWEIISASISEIPFCPLLTLCAYVFFPWKFPSISGGSNPHSRLVPKYGPVPGPLAGDLKYCLNPRSNPKQTVGLGRAQPAVASLLPGPGA